MLAQQIFCLVIAVVGAAALVDCSGLLKGRPFKGMFVYYTNQSNLLIVLFHAALFCAGFAPAGGLYRFLASAPVRLIVVVCITVTHLIYHFMLVPYYKSQPAGLGPDFFTFSNLSVHYGIPWAVILCWVFTADKAVPVWAAAAWLCLPIAYTVFAILRGRFGGTINGLPDGDRYPYPFLDVDALGASGLAKNLAIYTCGFFVLALVFVGLAALLRLAGL